MTKRQILVVDGDISHAERLKQNLEKEGYVVDVVYHGNDAVNNLKKKWTDLIITAINLQGEMNGIQLIQEVKNQKDFQKIPIIVQSSKINMKETVTQMGVELFIGKPYQMMDLIEQVKEKLVNH